MNKLTNKHLKIIGWTLFAVAAVLYVILLFYYKDHPEQTRENGKWIVIGILIVAMFFHMPWIREKKEGQ